MANPNSLPEKYQYYKRVYRRTIWATFSAFFMIGLVSLVVLAINQMGY
ncbi:MAG: hypothetical protein ACOX5W_00360 [Bacillota bacterium]|jgi:hypothetical protein